MLSVLFGETPDVFKQILEFYTDKGDAIIDLTYGHGKLWGSVDLRYYDLVSNDVDPESPAKWHAPIDWLDPWLRPFKRRFKVVVYDPPYLYGRHSHYLLTTEEKDKDWHPQKTEWTVEEQIRSARSVNQVAPTILQENGLLIVKIMNCRIKGELIRNNQIICENLSNFRLKDECIYVRTNVGFYRNKTTPQTAHGYYLIFKLQEPKQ